MYLASGIEKTIGEVKSKLNLSAPQGSDITRVSLHCMSLHGEADGFKDHSACSLAVDYSLKSVGDMMDNQT